MFPGALLCLISNIRLAKSSKYKNFNGEIPASINKGIAC